MLRVSAGLCCTGTFNSLAMPARLPSFCACAASAAALVASGLGFFLRRPGGQRVGAHLIQRLQLGRRHAVHLDGVIGAALGGEGIIVLAHFGGEGAGEEFRIGGQVGDFLAVGRQAGLVHRGDAAGLHAGLLRRGGDIGAAAARILIGIDDIGDLAGRQLQRQIAADLRL